MKPALAIVGSEGELQILELMLALAILCNPDSESAPTKRFAGLRIRSRACVAAIDQAHVWQQWGRGQRAVTIRRVTGEEVVLAARNVIHQHELVQCAGTQTPASNKD